MSSSAVLQVGTQAIEAFVQTARARALSPEENETFLDFVSEYARGVNAHVMSLTDFDFGRFKVRAEVLRARFSAPEPDAGDCGSEAGCEGCQNHFCKRRWPD